MFKGAIHIHSTYSDGELSLSQLRDIYLAAGCAFVCMTDHAEYFDGEKLESYKQECEQLSDERFRFIAGLEYECHQRMHVLGLGVTSLVKSSDPQEVIRHIRDSGGVSVIAHPMDTAFEWIESFETLPNGIETWNSKYDGRYAPRPATFRLVRRLRKRKSDLFAFYGQDLHWNKQFRGLFNMTDCLSPDHRGVLAALAEGSYFATKGDLELPSDAGLSDALITRFDRLHGRSDQLRRLFKGAKKIGASMGLRPPATLKSHLRKIF